MQAAIVTGVSRGLGESLAAALLARGFAVIGVGRTSAERLAGEHYRFVRCDLAQVAAHRARARAGVRRDRRGAPALGLPDQQRRRSRDRSARWARSTPRAIATSLAVNLRRAARAGRICSAASFADDVDRNRRIINVSSGAAQSAARAAAALIRSPRRGWRC